MSTLLNFLRALVVDPRSQRAMEETLRDAASEIARASGIAASMVATGRTALAVGRVCAGSFGRELRHLNAVPVVLVLLASFCVPVAVTVLGGLPVAPTLGSRAILVALLATGTIAAFFPLSAFVVGIAAAKWRASLLGLATVLVAAEIALVGWIMPEAFQQFRQRIYSTHRTATMSFQVPRGINELALPQLVDAARNPGARRARRDLSVRTTLCFATMWFVCLGYTSMRLSLRARICWAIAAALIIVSVGFFRIDGFALLLLAFGLAMSLAIVRAHRDPATS